MPHDVSPTARALLALESIQNHPGITAQDLGDRLGVSERAARRYVAILREADLPIESTTGPAGGYRVGRGLRMAPLMFTFAEALGLAMAVLEGHRDAADPADLVGGALAKILRVLPERVAGPVRAFRETTTPRPTLEAPVRPELATRLIESCVAARRQRVDYLFESGSQRTMDVDPWAVVLWRNRWYLLCWSHARQARRVLRVDRITQVYSLPDTFVPPPRLDAVRTLEEHFSEGWTHAVDVLIEAPIERVADWIPRSFGHLESDGPRCTRLRATTDDLDWYAGCLAGIPVPFRVLESADLQKAVEALSRRLAVASGFDAEHSTAPALDNQPPPEQSS